jgi:hypothetical protein
MVSGSLVLGTKKIGETALEDSLAGSYPAGVTILHFVIHFMG